MHCRLAIRRLLLSAVLVGPIFALAQEDLAEAATGPTATPAAASSDTEDTAARDFEWLREPGFDTVVCPFRGAIDYDPGRIECGLIRVPENREVDDSRTIELLFARIKATGEDKEGEPVEIRDDPIVYLTGGPGVSIRTYVDRFKDHTVIQQRDLIVLEQRGIANSGDFCPFWGARNRADRIRPEFKDAQRAALDDARECIERARGAGIDLSGYHTFENARDVRALRLALGLDSWNVWGISYGSVLGQAVLQVDPDGVQAMVIDAIVPLDLEALMRLPHWYARLLDRFFEACAAQDGCADAYPDLEARYRDAIATLLERPVEVDVPAGELYPDGRAWIFQDVIAGLPFGVAYEQKTHAAIPALMDGLARQVEQGNEAFFRAIALAADDGMGISVSMGMAAGVRCLDGYFEKNAAEASRDEAEHPLLSAAFGGAEFRREAADLCRELGLAPRDASQYALRDTDVPLVIANGAWDPITPPPLARYVAEKMPSARYVEFPHAGHGPTRSIECAGGFMNAFFDDPGAELDMDCVEDGEEAAEYITAYLATDAAQHALILAETDEKRLAMHAGWIGASLAGTLVGLLVLPTAWASRRLDRRTVARAGRSRLWTGLAALAAVLFVAGLGIGGALTAKTTPVLLLFGIAGPAPWTAWFGPLAALIGLWALVSVILYRKALPRATTLGLVLTASASISVGVFGWAWDLWPF
ncbi:alpha/beta fold hydrolase [Halomonas denitrificans]|nr:alpha/beta hydrolase [Halomonas denitrificans]